MRVLSNGGDTAGGFINGNGYGDGRESYSGAGNGNGADYCWGQVMEQVQSSLIYIKVMVKVLAVEIVTATQNIIKIKQHGN
jgi:hypothetical protein